MNIFRHRSFAFGCAIFLFVLFISKYTAPITRIIIGAASFGCLILLCALFLITKKKLFKNAIASLGTALILTVIAVLLTVFVMDARLSKASLCDESEHVVVGKIDKVLYNKEGYGIYSLDVSLVDGNKNKFKVSLVDDLGTLKENDEVTARVTFSQGYPVTLENGITFGAIAVEYISIQQGKNDFVDYLRYTNSFLDSLLCESLNADTYALTSAMFLGNRENLSSQINRDFTRIGLVHILSLSGMHVSIVVSIIGFFVSKLRLNRLIRTALICTLILAFLAITGFSETAMRAGFMQFIVFGAFFLKERTDGASALFVSVFIICLIDPFSVFSLSLQLSFLALLGCIASTYFIRRCGGKLKIRSKILRFCYFTLVATIFVIAITLPIVINRFGQFSLFSYFANIIITPVLNLLIYLTPLMLIVAKIPVASDVVASVCEWICDICLRASSFASRASFCAVSVSTVWQFFGIAVIFMAVVIFILLSKKQTRAMLICFACGVLIFVGASIGRDVNRNYNTYVSVSSTNDNDSIFVESKGKLTVIEACNNSLSLLTPVSALSELGYTEIENYVACDYSYKSYSYIDELTSTAIVRNVYLQKPFDSEESEWHDLIIQMLKSKGVCVKNIEDSFYIDDIRLDFCRATYNPNSKKRCVAFSMLINGARLTYLGSGSFESVDYFASDYAKASDFIFFGAYGPSYNVTYDYELDAIDGYAFFGSSKSFASDNMIGVLDGKSDISNAKIKIGR